MEVRHDLRLDLPLLEQYGIYLLNILHGDFGNSRRTSQSVMTDVSQRLPATLELIETPCSGPIPVESARRVAEACDKDPAGTAASTAPMDTWGVTCTH